MNRTSIWSDIRSDVDQTLSYIRPVPFHLKFVSYEFVVEHTLELIQQQQTSVDDDQINIELLSV